VKRALIGSDRPGGHPLTHGARELLDEITVAPAADPARRLP
jgi:hypothetical protein